MSGTTGAYRRGAALSGPFAALVGMHGVGSHSAGSHSAGSHGVTSEALTEPLAAAVRSDGRDAEPDGAAVAGLCVAVLSVLSLLALLTFLAAARRGGATALRQRLRSPPTPRPRGRDPGPLSLAQLSVLRR